MLYSTLENTLKFRYPHVVRSFGGTTPLVDFIAQAHPKDLTRVLALLLNFTGRLSVLDPVYSRFTLYNNDSIEQESVILQEPYSVFTLTGEKLYSVASHYGVFGTSVLDSLLIEEFLPGTLFLVDYLTYQGRKQLLIINGLLPSNVNKSSEVNLFKATTTATSSSRNQILFQTISGARDNTKPGLPFYPVTLYYLPTSSAALLSRNSVLAAPNTQRIPLASEGSPVVFHPTLSGWLAFSQEAVNNTLVLGPLAGMGVDRLLTSSPGLYYIAAQSDISIQLLRQSFGEAASGLNAGSLTTYTPIEITTSLNILQ